MARSRLSSRGADGHQARSDCGPGYDGVVRDRIRQLLGVRGFYATRT